MSIVFHSSNQIHDDSKDLMRLLLFNDPIVSLHTHNYGFHTATGRHIINTIKDALISLKYPSVDISVEKPKNKDHGDMSSNIALLLTKQLKKNPMEIAENLKTILDKSI